MRILLDMDGILVDLLNPWIEAYEKEHLGLHMKIEDVYSWDLHKCTPYPMENDTTIYDIINRPGWFRNLKPQPGAIEAVEKLTDNNECFIASSPSGPDSYKDKAAWIYQYFPTLKNNIILTKAKHLIKADVLIDDSPANAEAYRKAWPESKILTIRYPYNSGCEFYDVIANNYKFPEAAWETILDELL
jgi:5'(3')-deoxyribonucleotidase